MGPMTCGGVESCLPVTVAIFIDKSMLLQDPSNLLFTARSSDPHGAVTTVCPCTVNYRIGYLRGIERRMDQRDEGKAAELTVYSAKASRVDPTGEVVGYETGSPWKLLRLAGMEQVSGDVFDPSLCTVP